MWSEFPAQNGTGKEKGNGELYYMALHGVLDIP